MSVRLIQETGMVEFRPATSGESDAIEAFLVDHADTSMFLRSNLRAFGPCGGNARNATKMWIQQSNGEISGILGISTAGFVLVQLPAGATAKGIQRVLAGKEVNGIFGASEQVRLIRKALGLVNADAQLDDDEPLYSLDLEKLTVPGGPTHLRQAVEEDRVLLEQWRSAYLVETIKFDEAEAADLARTDVSGMLERGTLVLLVQADGTPVAMTSFNAILPDMAQVGNVYTPPDMRAKGYARRIVALHLQRAAQDGIRRAILFASGTAASRAYEAIGFEQIGNFTLLFFAQSHVVRAAA